MDFQVNAKSIKENRIPFSINLITILYSKYARHFRYQAFWIRDARLARWGTLNLLIIIKPLKERHRQNENSAFHYQPQSSVKNF